MPWSFDFSVSALLYPVFDAWTEKHVMETSIKYCGIWTQMNTSRLRTERRSMVLFGEFSVHDANHRIVIDIRLL